jgi:hypothetical protein
MTKPPTSAAVTAFLIQSATVHSDDATANEKDESAADAMDMESIWKEAKMRVGRDYAAC